MESADSAGSPAGILLVVVDRLPAWMLPVHGCTWVAMPALTRLAARGIVFDRVVATTDDAHGTLADLCGGGGRPADWGLVRATVQRGWSPLLVTDDPTAVDAAVAIRHVPLVRRRAPAGDEADTSIATVCAVAGEALAGGAHRLVVVHLTSLGHVWDAPTEFRARYDDPDDHPAYAGVVVPDLVVTDATDPDDLVGIRHAFAGQLTLLDRCIDGLVGRLPADGWCVMVAGLRGLPLGLHGRVGTGPLAAFGELVHLPAVLVDPAGRMAAQRYGGIVTPGDLGATLRELAGAPPLQHPADEPWRPRSLRGLLDTWHCPPRERVVAAVAAGAAIVTPDWHAVSRGNGPETLAPAPSLHLFAKPDDYFEMNDVAARCPAETERFAAALAAAGAGDPSSAWRG